MPPPYSVTLEGYVPPRRFPPAPGTWLGALIEEAASYEDGVARLGTLLADVVLNPVDVDPKAPMERSFTVNNAQLVSGWYVVVFYDAAGAEAPAEPVAASQPGVLPPDTNEVRDRSRLLRARYPAGGENEADFRADLRAAVAMVESITCRKLDATMPAELVELAFRAATLKTEQITVTGSAEDAEAAAGGRRLRSISAGPWSESYFAPGDLQVKNGRPILDPNPMLDETLWALMTEDCREQWIAFLGGAVAPAGAVTAFDYRRGRMGRGSVLPSGPDGW